MRKAHGYSLVIMLLVLALIAGAGCDGGGLDIKLATPDSGDQPDDGELEIPVHPALEVLFEAIIAEGTGVAQIPMA